MTVCAQCIITTYCYNAANGKHFFDRESNGAAVGLR